MIVEAIKLMVCSCSFLYTFYVLCHLTYFLSKRIDYVEKIEFNKEENTSWILMVNGGLLSAFVLQHSAMASDSVKEFYNKYCLEDFERSIYLFCSSSVLYFLICHWTPVPWMSLWNFNYLQDTTLWHMLSLVHAIGWCIVYFGCIMMDISELAGLKQVYYKLSGRPSPMALKSKELQRYLSNMRHPSFIGFLLILWVYPLMSIDRFIMASLLTGYMILMWTIDEVDYNYHSTVIAIKEKEISDIKD